MSARRVALVTAATTLAACPAVVGLLRRRGIVDTPNHRSSHARPTPRGGGLACAAGAVAGVTVAHAGGSTVPWRPLAGAFALAGLGGLDDVRGLAATPRLAVQVAAGAAIGAAALGEIRGTLVAAAVTPLVVNVTNFMDGINGISALTAVVWGANAVVIGRAAHRSDLCVVGAVALGAGAGFLPANLPAAHLFLGDVGSYLLGGLYSVGIVLAARDGEALLVTAPLAFYLADTMTTLARRAARGARLTEAHREHAYQRLVSVHGWSHSRTAAAAGLTATGSAALAQVGGTPYAALPAGALVALPDVLARRAA